MTDWQTRIRGYKQKPANQLTANPSNPRRHPGKQRDAMRGSLNELGFIAPVIENVTTGYILDGHLRIEEALSRDENMLIPVIEVELAPHEEATALASFDFITYMAEYDRDTLDALLHEAETADAGMMELLGELAEEHDLYFRDEPEPADDPGAGVDKAEELREKWQTERGQLWVIPSANGGEHRLLCGDSTDADDVARVTDDGIDAVITDPPYAFGLSSMSRMNTKSGGWHDMMNNASWFTAHYQQWKEISPKMPVWVFTNWRTLPVLMRAGFDSGVGITSVMVWYKDWIGPGGPAGLRPTYELIALTTLGGYTIPSRSVQDFVTVPASSAKPTGHGAEKPVGIMSHLIKASEDCNRIFDPYGGSGTTMVACEQLGRQCRMIEIEPKYCAVILERMAGMGLEPMLQDGSD